MNDGSARGAMEEVKETPEGLATAIRAWQDFKPTPKQCEDFSKMHKSMYGGRHFYILIVDRRGFGLTPYEFSSSNIHQGNILAIMEKSIADGTFKGLSKVTIKEYAHSGGHDVPCCLRGCKYEGDWPPCMRKDK